MKRMIPLLIAGSCGIVLIISAFVPAMVSWGEKATVWFDILAAIAFVLGGGNLLKIHLKAVSDKSAGWAYSLITVLTFAITLSVGMLKWGVPPAIDQEFYGETFISVPLTDLPESLTFIEPVDLDSKYAEDEIPDSVKRQLSFKQENGKITSLTFRGWMKSGQESELLAVHNNLSWQAAIESLAERAAIPDEFKGKVIYHANHESLSATGVLTDELQQKLISLNGGTSWGNAVSQLGDESSKTTAVQLTEMPPSFTVPDQYATSLHLDGDTLQVTGPLTPKMKNDLCNIFPRIRPMSAEDALKLINTFSSLDGGLTKEHQTLFKTLLDVTWNADQLIGALNDAGKNQPVKKTARELLKEKLAGVHELELTTPALNSDVELNDKQIKFLREKVIDADYDLANLGNGLEELGPWMASQQRALQKFLGKASTVGAKNKLICEALVNNGTEFSEEQYAFLLSSYRAEHVWKQQIHHLQEKSHVVKYPWSGAYLHSGAPLWYAYEYALKPLTATMFSLLAFYVASAAFRAFRAKNFEAFLLLATAFIVLLGRTYAGGWLSSLVPEYLPALRIDNITQFIMTVVNTAGNRAIMIGISLGIISTSLKILMGVDRSYLGSGDD